MLDFSVRESRNDMGLFANKRFHKGDIVKECSGKPATEDELSNYSERFGEYSIQIGDEMYLGADYDMDDYVNHSCEPSCGLSEDMGTFFLKAIRDIENGEEITFDYSTDVKDGWYMECNCGSEKCRGKINDFENLPKGLRKRYVKLGVVPKFILRGM